MADKCIFKFRLKTILKSTLVLVHLGSPQGWLRTKQQWCNQPCPHIQCVKWNLSNRRSSLSLGVSSSPSAATWATFLLTSLKEFSDSTFALSLLQSSHIVAEASNTIIGSVENPIACRRLKPPWFPSTLFDSKRSERTRSLKPGTQARRRSSLSHTDPHRVLRLSRRLWPSLELQFCNKGTKKSYVLHCRSTGCCIQVADIDPQGWIVVRCT